MKLLLLFIMVALPAYLILDYLNKGRSRAQQSNHDLPTELIMIDEKEKAAKSEGGDEYVVDSQRSKIKWFSKKMFLDTKHEGTVQVANGKVYKTNGELLGGEIVIDMTSIKNLDMEGKPLAKRLEDHLSSPDFFDVAKFPTAKFVVKSIEKLVGEGNGPNFRLVGDMTIKDRTNSVVFDARVTEEDNEINIKGDLSIDRTRWEVKYGSGKFFKGLGDDLIDDIIEYEIDLIAKK